MDIYVVGVELKPLRGAKYYGECVGLFVDCFVPADGEEDAKRRFFKEIEGKYEVIALEDVRVFGDIYENEKDQRQAEIFAKDALETDEIVYGDFYCYESEHEH